MSKTMIRVILGVVIVVIALWSMSLYNGMLSLDEEVKAKWSQVLNQYQRRADLIPNLVSTVKGYADHEEKVFIEVAKARSQVGSVNITADDLTDPKKMEQFQQAQGELKSAISRLLLVAERYPELKSNQNFLELQAQLEGTENRIAVERMRYIDIVKTFNTKVRRMPQAILLGLMGFDPIVQFGVENEAEINSVPEVSFE
ncbi:MAG: LemA family protein [Pseudomonadota bacterium]|nr:LemA family protein [Pseudomonadota bacterium]